MAQHSPRQLAIRAFAFNVLGLALTLTLLFPVAFSSSVPPPYGIFIAGLMFLLSRSALRPKIAEEPFSRQESFAWYAGAITAGLLAFAIARLLGEAGRSCLAYAAIGAMTWIWSFVTVREVRIVLTRPEPLS